MRLRNNPKAYEIMEENADLVILKPEEHKGHYHDIFEINQPLYIEIGMGKGDFIYQNALKHPENNYIGIEKFPSVLAAAINKINKQEKLVTQSVKVAEQKAAQTELKTKIAQQEGNVKSAKWSSYGLR